MELIDQPCNQEPMKDQFSVQNSKSKGVGQRKQGNCNLMRLELVGKQSWGIILWLGVGNVAKKATTRALVTKGLGEVLRMMALLLQVKLQVKLSKNYLCSLCLFLDKLCLFMDHFWPGFGINVLI